MKKQSRKVAKRCLAFLMVLFLLSINSFAAVVSDNDGSAFITKAEFDSLKNSFQSQIDQYNTSIDSKIDGAIASYLAGIRAALPWNIKNKSMKFLNQWNYATPQSYYYVNFTTSSVTEGLDAVGSGGGGTTIDVEYPGPSPAARGTLVDTYSGKKLGTVGNVNLTSGNVYFYFRFEIEGYTGSEADLYNKLDSISTADCATIRMSPSATQGPEFFVTNRIPLSLNDFEKITIRFYSGPYSQAVGTIPTYTVNGTPPISYSTARQLSERTVTETPSAATCTAVQVSNDGGKLIIDPKPFSEVKIQNVCTVECFNYQNRTDPSYFTSSNAFNDSSYNSATITLPEQWSWNTIKTSGSQIDKGTSTASKNNYITVQNFIGFTKASTQVLKNTTWGRPSYTTNVVTIDDGLTLDKNGASTSYVTIVQGTYTGTGKKLASSTATSITTYNSTICYPALKIPKYTYKQYSQQIYDYYSNDFTDGNGDMIKWGEGVLVGDCKAERDSSRVKIDYHLENMSGTAVASQPCIFELSTKKFVKCVAESGTSMGTQTVTPASSATNTVTFDIGATGANAELWLNTYCNTSNYTVVIDNIATE